MESSINFEDALSRLEEIVKELENGELEVEKALALFEEGTRLSRICAKKLSHIERRIEVLSRGAEGEETLELFQDVDAQEEE
jgi:exodeoxyribonuclease VII small subunit